MPTEWRVLIIRLMYLRYQEGIIIRLAKWENRGSYLGCMIASLRWMADKMSIHFWGWWDLKIQFGSPSRYTSLPRPSTAIRAIISLLNDTKGFGVSSTNLWYLHTISNPELLSLYYWSRLEMSIYANSFGQNLNYCNINLDLWIVYSKITLPA